MNIKIELTEKDIKKLIVEHIRSVMGDVSIDENFIGIHVKSKQNYKAEWETADIRAVYERM